MTEHLPPFLRRLNSNSRNKKQEGRPCRMPPQQLAQLSSELVQDPRSFGFSQSMWTTTMVIRHVQKRYHISYAARSMRKILTKLGFSPKKPRPFHYKSASESDRKVFKKKARRAITTYTKGYTPFCLDESTYVIAPNPRRAWYPRGKNIVTRINYTRKKFCAFGALGAGIPLFYDTANSGNFVDFVKSLQKRYGKILLFADNAAYHKSVTVRKHLEASKNAVKIIHFPRYTPELNPIEVQWRQIKHNLGNQFFSDTNQMKNCFDELIQRGEVPVVKLFDYLIP
jgi:transposase